jgi:Leucine-rich repeat (LRR) protein
VESEIAADASNVPPSRGRAWIVGLIVAAVLLGGAYVVVKFLSGGADEGPAIANLEKLGALVVKGADGHAASVNLSMLQAPDDLAAAIEQLPALTYVTALDVSRTAITDEQIKVIGEMTQLQSLALQATEIGDEGAAHLSALTNLQSLMLASTNLGDASVDVLGNLSGLKILDLSATRISDNLAPLAQLPSLEWLLLREDKLTGEALAALGRCKALKRLNLDGSEFPADAVAELHDALPQASITR